VNISPHHQRPTKYPWPGVASAVTVIIGLALIVVIALMVLGDSSTNDSRQTDPSGMRDRVVSSIERDGAH
jgi:hypothetical protein